MFTVAPRTFTRQYPCDPAPWTVTVWDVLDPNGNRIDSYNHKKSARYAATYATEMTALLTRAA